MDERNIVVLGKFDGVHMGHIKLLEKASQISRERSMSVVVYVMSFKKDEVITNDSDKENILRSLGADKVIVRTIDDELKNMMPDEFVQKIVHTSLKAGFVIVGENFRFGKGRCGDTDTLSKLCSDMDMECVVVDTVRMLSPKGITEVVSSTAIREYIAEGQVDIAGEYLGRKYSIKGVVTSGKHLGGRMGCPTANVYPPKNSLTMKSGVYASEIIIDGVSYKSITNVGCNPTIDEDKKVITETHILANTINCYGKTAEIRFIKFIRPEICFENQDKLYKQIEADICQVKKMWELP